ncbi:hypothetical protein PHAMO_340038 [Magnetospirillum molischianum DSM 120]|uniref:Uncharacterized protein n=1 Tax=Magnetospirillum molischianum DSM 120 TaxID=1150626 RepID=H8FUX7_MAGML|nr:hypothetical protein PHAMO_340038 [Magnetospirillum molischianum DSM 120]
MDQIMMLCGTLDDLGHALALVWSALSAAAILRGW